MSATEQVWEPCWVSCPDCGDFICTQHNNEHVADCDCPPIDEWAEHDVWPYKEPENATDTN